MSQLVALERLRLRLTDRGGIAPVDNDQPSLTRLYVDEQVCRQNDEFSEGDEHGLGDFRVSSQRTPHSTKGLPFPHPASRTL